MNTRLPIAWVYGTKEASMNIRRIVVTGVAALALVAGGTAAGAAIAGPIDGSGVIHACYFKPDQNGSSQVVLQDASTACPKNSTQITWNHTGPQGPQGATGAQGAAGPSTAGPSGLDVTTVNDRTTVQPGDTGGLQVHCPADHPYAVGGGGGWTSIAADDGPFITASIPFNGGAWFISGANPTGSPTGATDLIGFAVCVK